MNIGVVRLGTFTSVTRAFERLGRGTELVAPGAFYAGPLVFPGQGKWDSVLSAIKDGDFIEKNLHGAYPYLGICMGMQMLFEKSEEGPEAGVCRYQGAVKRLPKGRLPHMGWNLVGGHAYYYFCHTYYCEVRAEMKTESTTYEGFEFTASMRDGPLWACQFHPEKSQLAGAEFLSAWLKECAV